MKSILVAINAELAIEEVVGRTFPWCSAWEAELKELFAAYVEAKQRQNVLDYDDLLLYWAHTLSDPGFAADIGGRFEHVLVDEYQDTNRLQAAIILALKPGGHGLTVVGDDSQSIYSFRAATIRNILDFPTQFSPRYSQHRVSGQTVRPLINSRMEDVWLDEYLPRKYKWPKRFGAL